MVQTIEFLGMPEAGKTTAIEVAESYIKKEGKTLITVIKKI